MNVQLPDGKIVSFPDSMSRDEIEKALFGLSSPPPTKTGRWQGEPSVNVAIAPPAERWPAGLGQAGVEGLALAAGVPGDVEHLVEEYLLNPALKAAGLPAQTNLLLPTSETILAGTNKLGLTGNPRYAPQSSPERFAQAGVRGMTAAAPYALLGQPLLPTLVGGTVGGLSSQAASELGAPRAVQEGAGFVGGLSAQTLARSLGRNISHIARDLGTSSNLQEAGIYIQDASRSWLKNEMPALLSATWQPVDALIPSTTPTSLSSFQSTLGSINTTGGRLQPLIERLRPALPKTIANLLSKTPAGVGQPLTWSEVQSLRSALGDAMSSPKLMQDIGPKNLERLYAAISEDMKSSAQSVGPDALDAFNSANSTSRSLYDFAEGTLGKIIRGVKEHPLDPKPEDVAARLLAGARRGGTDIENLRTAIPDAVDELAAAHLRMNPSSTAWKRLSPQAQESLVLNHRDRAIIAATQGKLPTLSDVLQTDRSILGTLVGTATGTIGGTVLGHLDPVTAGAVGGIAGAVTPQVLRGAKNIVTNPLSLVPPGVGAEAGGQY